MIELRQASVYYQASHQPAISNVSLSFKPGEFVCVLGPSGAGKSTMIRTINALQPLTEGEVLLNGKSIHHLNKPEVRKWRSEAGMIFQHFHLIPRMSVRQNVLTGLFGKKSAFFNFFGTFTEDEKNKAALVLEQVGLSEMAERRVEWLSGGQKQRVGIARALMQEPSVFLGDEPVASLDPGTARTIFQLLRSIHDENKLISIINVHDVFLAKEFASRVVGLSRGQVIFDGPPQELQNGMIEKIYGQAVSV
ncbi:phosphonate ABC transporter ATP-binding protein [Alteribacillus sp. HJP-4]|uniref:phosphonate ABC transporter ATP-binding protein n=1 Tax=Alteribacillus sp. HJP-4 TaxID=2775394 RepID=UPI0035CCDD4B